MTPHENPRRQPLIVLSVDVEPDAAMFVRGTTGLTEGLPRLTELFDRLDVPADFFFTLDAARQVPDFVRELASTGQWLGCHGRDHETAYYSRKSATWQARALQEATAGIRSLSAQDPRLFRAPNFSISGSLLAELDRLGYAADSSVLPGRRKKRYRLLPVVDHRLAPREPYHPDSRNPCAHGTLRLWEMPVTENPFAPGGPIGLGFVNMAGEDRAYKAVEDARGRLITILCHPWEAIDLGRHYAGLPDWLSRACRSNLAGFEHFLHALRKAYTFVRIQDVLGGEES